VQAYLEMRLCNGHVAHSCHVVVEIGTILLWLHFLLHQAVQAYLEMRHCNGHVAHSCHVVVDDAIATLLFVKE
jgi:hypothetical protein